MKKIMFICHGNICRSPMAESIMTFLVKQAHMENAIKISSCATSTEELGNPIYRPARAILTKKHIPVIEHYATQLKRSEYDEYDYLIAMDSFNIRNIFRIIDSDPQNKVFKLLDFTEAGGDVDDPWYSGDFETAYRDIFNGCNALLNKIRSGE